jgi:hypothetical protein
MLRLDSSAITAVEYDLATWKLDVTFTSGRRYTYFDVPEWEYEGLINAPSAGEYFNGHIRGEYDFRERS